jgi:RNA polymerase sigma factor (sigma-70 family)
MDRKAGCEYDDAALLTGTPEQFGLLYRRHEDVVMAFFLRRTGRADLACDLTAETFARALGGRARFDRTLGEPLAWLFGIARNVLARSLERGRVDDEARRRLGFPRLAITDDELLRIEELEGEPALRALDGLPVDQRSAIKGRVLDDREYAELASAMRCSECLVRQRVSRGLRTLRSRLGGAT